MIAIHRNRGWIRRYWRDLAAARRERGKALTAQKLGALIKLTDELTRFSSYRGDDKFGFGFRPGRGAVK